ncbi:MAG TPA: hypothetical protein PLM53_16890 [Spirochaetota bacterium]|nr:hypothetical protein [Spirochaetota bacterium]HPC39857.1 hypothetical protein [Spirochaetota bacterium]HPL16479.1 hypothetical protein [Spirochaetota bacterium]HQF08967.1 hypothetical protein [Spirochaetota bacterium]HQH98775.1 hypothetical protein [Spirochaetota bacterium]
MAKKAVKTKSSKPKKSSKKAPAKKSPATISRTVKKPKVATKPRAVKEPKAAQKRSAIAKPAPKADAKSKTLRKQMLVQISALAATLDDESLKKLIQSAAMLAHNERVLKEYSLRKELAAPKAPAATAAIEEGKDGTFFIIILNGYRNFFSLEEMRRLVKVCHGTDNAAIAASRIYTWLEGGRFDVLRNSRIASSNDAALIAVWEKIISTYSSTD